MRRPCEETKLKLTLAALCLLGLAALAVQLQGCCYKCITIHNPPSLKQWPPSRVLSDPDEDERSEGAAPRCSGFPVVSCGR